MATSAHWLVKYVKEAKWVAGGRGPLEFDCWGLLRWIARHEFDRPWLPQYPIPPHKTVIVTEAIESAVSGPEWRKLSAPIHGCAVGLSHHTKLHHVGFYIHEDGGMVLHALTDKGVLAQSLSRLKLDGWNRIDFYWHSSWTINPQPSSS